jgi:NADH:ubiquinone oxidoreductase subunit 5 (subunit L)/multisubunit Na+/H+ antiporter MnhA subunit
MGLYVAAGCALAGTAGTTGTTGTAGPHALALAGLSGAAEPWRDLAAAGIVVAALGKSAQLPFSFWLSRAMAGPSPVSALLHSATMVAAGAYLLLRLHSLLAATAWAEDLVAWTGALTALALGAVAFGVGALALAGLPPLSLWITKDTILTAAAGRSAALYAVGLAAGMLSAAYAAIALYAVWRPVDARTRDDTEQPGTRQVGRPQLLPLPPLAAVAAVAGAVGLPAVAGEFQKPAGSTGEPRAGVAELAVSGILAAVTALAAMALTRRPPRVAAGRVTAGRVTAGRVTAWVTAWTDPLSGWLRLERLAGALVVRPVLALAGALARFDDRVVDGGVRAAAAVGDLMATLANVRVEVRIDGIVDDLGRGARRLGTMARRPQTGQVHTYYAQAAVLLAALVVLLVLAG